METDLVFAVWVLAATVALFAIGVLAGLFGILRESKGIRKSMATATQALTDLQTMVANLTAAITQAVTDITELINQVSALNGLNPTAVEAVVAQGNAALANLQTAITAANNELNPPPPNATSVSVSPATATIAVGATQQFTASVAGTTNQTVEWSASDGSIDQTGLFTAPASAGSATITAASQQTPSVTGSASVSFS